MSLILGGELLFVIGHGNSECSSAGTPRVVLAFADTGYPPEAPWARHWRATFVRKATAPGVCLLHGARTQDVIGIRFRANFANEMWPDSAGCVQGPSPRPLAGAF